MGAHSTPVTPTTARATAISGPGYQRVLFKTLAISAADISLLIFVQGRSSRSAKGETAEGEGMGGAGAGEGQRWSYIEMTRREMTPWTIEYPRRTKMSLARAPPPGRS